MWVPFRDEPLQKGDLGQWAMATKQFCQARENFSCKKTCPIRGGQAVSTRQYAGWYRGGVPFEFDEIT